MILKMLIQKTLLQQEIGKSKLIERYLMTQNKSKFHGFITYIN
jgi:hypothetical protein